MALFGPSQNGINTHKTQVAKFLYGGRLDNIFKSANKIVNGMEDPSYLAFTFGVDTSTSGLFSLPGGFDDLSYDYNMDRNYGVLTYLANAISPNASQMRSGDTINPDNLYEKKNGAYSGAKESLRTFSKEYKDMKKFVDGFKEITINHPYMLQSVEGLQDTYKKYYNMHKDSYLGGNDTKIKIKCLEAMDLRMSALFDSYYRAAYNHKYRRMNIPRNILRFDCWLLVHDLRNIKIDQGSILTALSGSSTTEEIAYNLSTILFKFKNCIFDIEEIGSMLGNISNAETNVTTFEFAFNYTDVEIYVNSLADILEAASDTDKTDISDVYRSQYDTLDVFNLNDEMNSLSNLTGSLVNIGKAIFNYATQGSSMGNVYDESWAGILSSMISSISNTGVSGILNNAIGKGMNILKSEADQFMKDTLFKKKEETAPKYTNTFADTGWEHGNITEENIYDDTNSYHVALTPDNLYVGQTNSSNGTIVNDTVYADVTNYHAELTPDTIYTELIDSESRFSNDKIDINDSGQHEQLDKSKLFENTYTAHEKFKSDKISLETNMKHDKLEKETIKNNPKENAKFESEMINEEPVKNVFTDILNIYPEQPDKAGIKNIGNAYN